MRQLRGFFPVEPSVVVARVDDNGHPRMDPAHEFVGFGGHDGEGLQPVPFLVFPGVPEAREADGVTVCKFEDVGLFGGLRVFDPFIEAVRRHDATSFLKRLTPSRSLGDGLGPRIDGGQALDVREFFGEERDQSLSGEDDLTFARFLLCRTMG